jgi:hypothetical protein
MAVRAAAGALLGVAVLMKQHAVFLAAFGAIMALRAVSGAPALVVAGIAASLLTAADQCWPVRVYSPSSSSGPCNTRRSTSSERTILSGVRTLAFALAEVSHASRGFLAARRRRPCDHRPRAHQFTREAVAHRSVARLVCDGRARVFYFRDHYFVLMLAGDRTAGRCISGNMSVPRRLP